MLLHFTGKTGKATLHWTDYAKLRDNVQHHVEGAQPSRPFEMIHRIERAVDSGSTTLDAYRLHHELVEAWYALAEYEPQDIAIGNRTLAVVLGVSAGQVQRHTRPVSEVGLQLPRAKGGYLCNLFEDTFRRLLAVTTTARPGDALTVTRLSYTKSGTENRSAA